MVMTPMALVDAKACSSRSYCLLNRISAMYMSGPTTTMIHAPSLNLAMAKISTTKEATTAEVALHHARAGHGEAGEHADGVQGHQRVDLRVEDDDQHQRDRPQHEDPVGEGEAMSALGELSG